MLATPTTGIAKREKGASPTYGRFLQPDPLGYEESPNPYSYVDNDPVNLTDPLGLCAAGEQRVFDTGSRIGRCVAAGSSDSGGIAAGFSPGFLGLGSGGGGLSSGYYEYVSGSVTGSDATSIVITAGHWQFVPNVNFGMSWRAILGSIGTGLDEFAESHLRPPASRQASETRSQCISRISGFSPALAIAGLSSIGAGGAFLGYPRTGLAGGGAGTSLISSAARGSFGTTKFGGMFGTGSVGGAIGRVLSRVSVFGGAAAFGYSSGTIAGAVQKCR